MHPLHEYVAKQLAEKLKSKKVVIWYDVRGEFAPFVAETRGGPRTSSEPMAVSVAGVTTQLAEYAGSMFELRAAVEPHVCGDVPASVLLYLPGCEHDRHASVLMELEKAGTTWEPQLKQLAKNVLLQKYTLGMVDDMLPFDRRVTYEDLTVACSNTSSTEPPSILKSIFHESSSSNDGLLAAWLVSDARDADIEAKDAARELCKLIRSHLGLELADDATLTKLRAVTLRYVLAGEFRSDLNCPPPACLDGVPSPKTKEAETTLRELSRHLRAGFPEAYAGLADRIENELLLRNAKLPPSALGAIDTFRFEERSLLTHCGELVANKKFEEALKLVGEREHSFWLDRDVGRKAQWEACRRMAELGSVATSVRAAVHKAGGDANAWIEAYTNKEGWYRVDQAQRRLEAWVANLDEEPEERPLGIVRRTYEDTCHAMAEGFTKALVKAGWSASASLPQTRVFAEVVAEQPKPVAYFLVDAMRFEMGVELAERLPRTSEIAVRHAVSALPSITPIGMAALQPGASQSFSVVAQAGKLGARIEDVFLSDLASRRKFAAARVPNLVDITLDELLSLAPSKLGKKLDGAVVVVVRSQEIDHAGEAGFTFSARQVMDTVIDNLARAIRKLAAAGVEHAVVSADHGHLFFASDRDESMRTDAPGGDEVDLHRRCWIGRGGARSPGCVRATAAELGYVSDLDFVFPMGSGVFKAGGDLAFHHGGPSLQEMIVPVITVRTKMRPSARPSAGPITASGLPEAVTNRIFSVMLAYGEKQMMLGATERVVRPLLMSGGKQVGAVGMADAELDRATGCVKLEPNKPASVWFQLSDDSVASLRVVILDPATDAELYRSPADIPVKVL